MLLDTVQLGGPYFQIPAVRLDTRAVIIASQATNGLPSADSAQPAATSFAFLNPLHLHRYLIPLHLHRHLIPLHLHLTCPRPHLLP